MSKILQLHNRGLTIRNSADKKKAEILLYDQIGGSWWSEGITATKFSEEIKALPEDLEELNIRVNSPGGDVFQGMTIYNRIVELKRSNKKLTIKVHVDGLAASIASVIAMAGDEVIMGAGAMFMIHKPWTFEMGNSNAFERAIMLLDKIEHQMIGIYKKKCSCSTSELEKMLSDETWLTAEETVEYGFATSTSDDEVEIAASALKSKWFFKAPEVKDTMEARSATQARAKAMKCKNEIGEFLARK